VAEDLPDQPRLCDERDQPDVAAAVPGGTKRQKGIDPRPVRTILAHLGEPLEPPLVSPPADASTDNSRHRFWRALPKTAAGIAGTMITKLFASSQRPENAPFADFDLAQRVLFPALGGSDLRPEELSRERPAS